MSGILYSTEKFIYPRIQIKFCNITVDNINNCESEDFIRNVLLINKIRKLQEEDFFYT